MKNIINIQNIRKIAVILFASSILLACEEPDSIRVLEVDNKQVLTDAELVRLSHEHGSTTHTYKPVTINFGFDLRSSPQEDAKQYIPFLEYLKKTTGYEFNLRFTPQNSSTSDELGKNKIQLAAMGAVSFIKAEKDFDAQLLVRGINLENKNSYQSFFVVRPNSPIKSFEDFRGKSLAFGSIDSTQGHIIPRIELQKHDIVLKDFSHYHYTGSHRNCAETVISNKADICAMQDQMARSLENQGLIKIIYASDNYPSSGIVANKSLSENQIENIKQALLSFNPKGEIADLLYHWELTEMPNGFSEANPEEYDLLKQWLYDNIFK